MSVAKIYTYKGFIGTLNEIIDHFDLDINKKTLSDRLQKGWSIEDTIETPLNKSNVAKIYTYKGFTGSTQEIISHFELDINHMTLRNRLYNGISIKEAIEYPFNNNYLDKLKQLSIDEGIPLIDIYNIINSVPYTVDKIKKMAKESKE